MKQRIETKKGKEGDGKNKNDLKSPKAGQPELPDLWNLRVGSVLLGCNSYHIFNSILK